MFASVFHWWRRLSANIAVCYWLTQPTLVVVLAVLIKHAPFWIIRREPLSSPTRTLRAQKHRYIIARARFIYPHKIRGRMLGCCREYKVMSCALSQCVFCSCCHYCIHWCTFSNHSNIVHPHGSTLQYVYLSFSPPIHLPSLFHPIRHYSVIIPLIAIAIHLAHRILMFLWVHITYVSPWTASRLNISPLSHAFSPSPSLSLPSLSLPLSPSLSSSPPLSIPLYIIYLSLCLSVSLSLYVPLSLSLALSLPQAHSLDLSLFLSLSLSLPLSLSPPTVP